MDFLVRRKLQNKGYEGNYFFNEVMEDGRQEKLIVDIRTALKKDVEIILKTNLEIKTYGESGIR